MAWLPRVSMGFAVIAALALTAVRLGSVVAGGPFSLVATSGAEEEAALGIWRAAQGAIYTDPLKVPFTASYYNWLFFAAYGGFADGLARLVPQVPEAFPAFGRLFTLLGLGGGLALFLAAVGRNPPSMALAAFAFLGPLVGWWAVSLHPEIWATTLTLAAVLAMTRLYDRMPVKAVLLACLASLAAWSFKQSYVYGAVAMGLVLLSYRDWRGLGLAVGLHAAGMAATLALGGEIYRHSLVLAGSSGFSLPVLWHVLGNALPKSGVLVLLVLPMLVSPAMRRALMAGTGGRMALGLALACCLGIPATAKLGASESYYIPVTVAFALLAARAGSWVPARPWLMAQSLAWIGHGVLCVAVLAGLAGVASVAEKDGRYRAQRQCVADLPAPLWAADPYLSLPWMHAQGPHFIEAYDYRRYRALGLDFEKGGLGGMVANRQFAALVFSHGGPPGPVDGQDVTPRYVLVKSDCAGLDIYVPHYTKAR